VIVAEISIVPLGVGTSVSKYVKACLEVIKKRGLRAETSAMCTIVETKTLEELFEVVKEAHKAVLELDAKRVTRIAIDDRKDKDVTIATKLEALKC
jgi:uncharacterized protein (TIGR00106 family)